MIDTTANERQHRRLARLSSEGMKRKTVVVHSLCTELFQEVRPYLIDPKYGEQLLFAVQGLKRKNGPVNVSQVSQLSPLRYPGGKTWLVPEVKSWVRTLGRRTELFIEPFAGGAITGLSVAADSLADETILAEKDPAVAALWSLLIHGGESRAEELFSRIISFEMEIEQVKAALSGYPTSAVDKAFATIVKNRVNRGGILAPGASMMKSGENGRGLRSRWYPQTLVKRMRAIRSIRQRLSFVEADAFDVIEEHAHRETATWFVDPPYTAGGKKAGSRLYAFNEIDHELLFQRMASCAGAVMMTYDDAPEVRALAKKNGFSVREVPMKTTHHEVKSELLLLKA